MPYFDAMLMTLHRRVIRKGIDISIPSGRFAAWLIVAAALCGCQSSTRGTRENPSPLGQKLDAILHRQDNTKAVFIARVLELPSRREIYAHDIDAPFIPASNLKLFTTSTGLDRFGPDHVFKT